MAILYFLEILLILWDTANCFSCQRDISAAVFGNGGAHRHWLIILLAPIFEIFVAITVLNIDQLSVFVLPIIRVQSKSGLEFGAWNVLRAIGLFWIWKACWKIIVGKLALWSRHPRNFIDFFHHKIMLGVCELFSLGYLLLELGHLLKCNTSPNRLVAEIVAWLFGRFTGLDLLDSQFLELVLNFNCFWCCYGFALDIGVHLTYGRFLVALRTVKRVRIGNFRLFTQMDIF